MGSSEGQKKPKSVTLRPFHRANSDRLLESTQNSAVKVFLNVPEQLQISNHSFIQDKDGNRRATRYYLGCKTIFLDEQVAEERKNNEKKKVIELKDLIFIKGGSTDFVDQEPFRTLFQFVTTHNDNVSNPNRVAPPNGEDYTAFMELDNQKEADQEIDLSELRELAYSYLRKAKSGMGANRTYNEKELAKLSSIFGINFATPSENYNYLTKIAEVNPAEFVDRIEKAKGYIITDVEAARNVGALVYKEGEFYINDELVYTPSENAKSSTKKDAEFINFLSTQEGGQVYVKLRAAIEEKTLNPK